MPAKEGYTATGKIREFRKAHGLDPTPIIALTAHAMISGEQKSTDVSCDTHITKPIKKAERVETIWKIASSCRCVVCGLI